MAALSTKKAAVKKAAGARKAPAAFSRPDAVETVAGVLENYASRGVFRGFSRGAASKGKAAFRMMWHKDRFYEFHLDVKAETLTIPVVLPDVSARSDMYRELAAFLESRHSEELPPHRRIDAAKAELFAANRKSQVSVGIRVKDGDFEYATRKLVGAVHEVFLDFLSDGRYYEWVIETYEIDPDRMG